MFTKGESEREERFLPLVFARFFATIREIGVMMSIFPSMPFSFFDFLSSRSMLVNGGRAMTIATRIIYIVIIAGFVVVSIFLVNFLPFKGENSSILQDQAASLASLLPEETDSPSATSAEPSPQFAQKVSGDVHSVPTVSVVPLPVVAPAHEKVKTQQSVPALTQPVGTVAPASYVYFYTGVPVQSAPATTIVYTGGLMTAAPARVMPVMPVVQPYAVPVFVPRVVPSRVGAPKWVYSNGVVIKPTVYYPRQPVRNVVRGVTP